MLDRVKRVLDVHGKDDHLGVLQHHIDQTRKELGRSRYPVPKIREARLLEGLPKRHEHCRIRQGKQDIADANGAPAPAGPCLGDDDAARHEEELALLRREVLLHAVVREDARNVEQKLLRLLPLGQLESLRPGHEVVRARQACLLPPKDSLHVAHGDVDVLIAKGVDAVVHGHLGGARGVAL